MAMRTIRTIRTRTIRTGHIPDIWNLLAGLSGTVLMVLAGLLFVEIVRGQTGSPSAASLASVSTSSVSPSALSFSQQPGFKRVAKWNVSGCPGRAVSIHAIRALASSHGVVWWSKDDAADALSKRTVFGVATTVVTGISVAALGLSSTDSIKMSAGWKAGFGTAAVLAGIVTPLVKGRAPVVDARTDKDLSVDTNGCGETVLYSEPGKIRSFVTEVPK